MKKNARPPRRNAGPRTFSGHSSAESYSPSSAAHSLEEKFIVAALKRCGGEGVPSRSLQRESGIRDKDAFYGALHHLEESGEVLVDKDHWVKLAPPVTEIEATLVSISERFGFARPTKAGEDIFIPGRDLNGAFVGDTVIL